MNIDENVFSKPAVTRLRYIDLKPKNDYNKDMYTMNKVTTTQQLYTVSQ
jgi:hypothetical protein